MGETAPIRTLIVDDEPVARQVLREELRGSGDIEIVAEAEDGNAALAAIERARPELVFLDLKMPGMGGLEVIRRLTGGVLPMVIIVTAYDEHAVHAFDLGALDYLLKPVSRERLEKALERVRARRGHMAEVAESLVRLDDAAERPAGRSRKVVGRAGTEYYLLDLGRRAGLSGGARNRLGDYRAPALHGHADAAGDRPAAGRTGLPAGTPRRAGEREPRAQNDAAIEPAMDADTEQRPGVRRQQAPGQDGARDSAMVTGNARV